MDSDLSLRTVLVRGLPANITKDEVRSHFRQTGSEDVDNVVLLQSGEAMVGFKDEQGLAEALSKVHRINDKVLEVARYSKRQTRGPDTEEPVFSEVTAVLNKKLFPVSGEQQLKFLIQKLASETGTSFWISKKSDFLLWGSYEQVCNCYKRLNEYLASSRQVDHRYSTVHGPRKCLNSGEGADKREIRKEIGTGKSPSVMCHGLAEMDGYNATASLEDEKRENLDDGKRIGQCVEVAKVELEKKEGNETFKQTIMKGRNLDDGCQGISTGGMQRKEQKDNRRIKTHSDDHWNLESSAQGPPFEKTTTQVMHENEYQKITNKQSLLKPSIIQNRSERQTVVGAEAKKLNKKEGTVEAREFQLVSENIWKVFYKSHKREIQDIESKFKVKLEARLEESRALVHPEYSCSLALIDTALKELSKEYDKVASQISSSKFLASNQEDERTLRKVVSEVSRQLPIVVAIAADRKAWEVTGEGGIVDEFLKRVGEEVKITLHVDDEGDNNEEGGNDEDDEYNDDEYDNEEGGNDEDDESNDEDDDEDTDDEDTDDDLSNRDGQASNCEMNQGGIKNIRLKHRLDPVEISVYQGDITDEYVDVIVNAANVDLVLGEGVAGAILSKGGRQIQEESFKIIKQFGKLQTGDAVMTSAGKLPCKGVIHTVGPEWHRFTRDESMEQLYYACLESLHTAENHHMRSIAIPSVGSGIYGVPKDICARVMFDVVEDYNHALSDSNADGVTDVRFLNIDAQTVVVFAKEFRKRYGPGNLATTSRKPNGMVSNVADSGNGTRMTIKAPSAQKMDTNASWRTASSMHKTKSSPVLGSQSSTIKSKPVVQTEKTEPERRAAKVLPTTTVRDVFGDATISRKSQSGSVARDERKQEEMASKRNVPLQSFSGKMQGESKGTSARRLPSLPGESKTPQAFGGARPKVFHGGRAQERGGEAKTHAGKEDEQTRAPAQGQDSTDREASHQGLRKRKLTENDNHILPNCPVCLGPFKQPTSTLEKCGHTFCVSCLNEALAVRPTCPVCRDPQDDGPGTEHAQGASKPRGTQPEGCMRFRKRQFSLPGYEGHNTIIVQYSFPGGIQNEFQPNPGQPYTGTDRVAYLPDTTEGREVLSLLQKAFEARMVFKIGFSMTSQRDNQIVWNVLHKTVISGGPESYGYPDPFYLSDVKGDLNQMGFV